MTLTEVQEQCRTRGNTDTLVATDVKLVVLDDNPEIVAVMWRYERQRYSKPWYFLMKKEDLSLSMNLPLNRGKA